MPTIQFDHDVYACLPSHSISPSLRVKHTMEINGASQQPVELRNPSLSLLRAMSLGTDMRIELMCLLDGAPVPSARVQTFSFISAILTKIREATCGAESLHQTNAHGESGGILRHFIVLRHDSETSVEPRHCLQSLELTLSLPRRIHEFAQGLHAFDLYSVLENPPLPLQLCFDDLLSQLIVHLNFCYPSLFGEHAKTLRKNTVYLNSILTSLSRIFDRSASDSLKQQAKSHQLRLLKNVRSRLQNLAEVLDSTGASIEDPIVAVEESANALAHSINQDMCCVWLRLQPSEKRGNLSIPVRDTDELEIHEDLPEPPLEDEDSRGDPMIDTDSDGEFNMPWRCCSASPAQSILDTDSLPTSPYSHSIRYSNF
ncbi:unnamed protein product [Rhizoctonia solani]|uniref:Uncharacterized protein n=1 Tax=Rhizoctonia solani TaxID=456999 RepID=A0A8H2XII6_9AGAM|nr:unnamed protein product [Rhizoctonia solani]